ncbi:MAG: hypothetical protein IT330_10505, partial [Anaerolineae bacterium]|nr:hypothetical protein [Anaerolineae bacterium]
MRRLLNKKILLILGIVIFLVVIGGGVFLVTGGFAQPVVLSLSVGAPAATASPSLEEPTPAPTTVHQDPLKMPPASGIMIDLGAKVVNLADPGGYRYLRVGLVLEFAPPASYYLLKQEGAKKAEELKKEEEKVREEVTLY